MKGLFGLVFFVYVSVATRLIVPKFSACSHLDGTGPVSANQTSDQIIYYGTDYLMEPGWDSYDYIVITVVSSTGPGRVLVNSVEISSEMRYSSLADEEKIRLHNQYLPTVGRAMISKNFTDSAVATVHLSRRMFKNDPFHVIGISVDQNARVKIVVESGTSGVPCTSRIFFLVYGVPLISLCLCNAVCCFSILMMFLIYYRCGCGKKDSKYSVLDEEENVV